MSDGKCYNPCRNARCTENKMSMQLFCQIAGPLAMHLTHFKCDFVYALKCDIPENVKVCDILLCWINWRIRKSSDRNNGALLGSACLSLVTRTAGMHGAESRQKMRAIVGSVTTGDDGCTTQQVLLAFAFTSDDVGPYLTTLECRRDCMVPQCGECAERSITVTTCQQQQQQQR